MQHPVRANPTIPKHVDVWNHFAEIVSIIVHYLSLSVQPLHVAQVDLVPVQPQPLSVPPHQGLQHPQRVRLNIVLESQPKNAPDSVPVKRSK